MKIKENKTMNSIDKVFTVFRSKCQFVIICPLCGCLHDIVGADNVYYCENTNESLLYDNVVITKNTILTLLETQVELKKIEVAFKSKCRSIGHSLSGTDINNSIGFETFKAVYAETMV